MKHFRGANMVLFYILITVFLNSCSRACVSESLQNCTDREKLLWDNPRLPESVIPLEYDIFLHPNLTTMDYSGKVDIKCEVRNATNFIVLHSKDLVISRVELTTLPSNDVLKLRRQTESKPYDQLYFELETYISSDTEILITIEFYGNLMNHHGYGFYATEYFINKNETGIIASTQFEAVSARRAFPCFDEPDLKAKFSMAIVRDKDYLSLFNMPLIHSMPYGENLMLDTFQQSVKMSTYLVAFAICNYASVSNQTKSGINVTLYVPRDRVEQADYSALEVALRVLDYFSSRFDVPYPLPKLDMIAIPKFQHGGMENWGLITLMSSAVLSDPARTSYKKKFGQARLVAHELAHQWFGNIVTMKWWNDIWLNEGFATFMSFIGLQAMIDIFPLENEFTTRIRTLDCEDFLPPRSIVRPVLISSPAVVSCVTYKKGSSLLLMLRGLLGENDFNIGINTYLKEHLFSTVVTDDLWQALSSSSNDGIDIKSVMETWVLEPGYPVVTVNRQGDEVHISQERFVFSNNLQRDQGFQSGVKWNIPFVYGVLACDGNITYNTTFLKDISETVSIRSGDQLVKGNYGGSGYYRVNYDIGTWKAISEKLNSNHQIFSQEDRAQLLSDVIAFARSGLVNMTILLELTKYLENETDYLPWHSITLILDSMYYRRKTTELGPLKTELYRITTKNRRGILRCDKKENVSTVRLCKELDNIRWYCRPRNDSKKSKRYLFQRTRDEARIEQNQLD